MLTQNTDAEHPFAPINTPPADDSPVTENQVPEFAVQFECSNPPEVYEPLVVWNFVGWRHRQTEGLSQATSTDHSTTIILSKDDIATLNFNPVLRLLGDDIIPEGHALVRMMKQYDIRILGYGSHPYRHRQVGVFFHELHRIWPNWFYFLTNRYSDCFYTIALSVILMETHLRTGTPYRKIGAIDTALLAAFIEQGLGPLFRLMERAEMSKLDTFRRTIEISEWYSMPFERDISLWPEILPMDCPFVP